MAVEREQMGMQSWDLVIAPRIRFEKRLEALSHKVDQVSLGRGNGYLGPVDDV